MSDMPDDVRPEGARPGKSPQEGGGIGAGIGYGILAHILGTVLMVLSLGMSLLCVWPFAAIVVLGIYLSVSEKHRRAGTGILIVSAATWLIVIGPCIGLIITAF